MKHQLAETTQYLRTSAKGSDGQFRCLRICARALFIVWMAVALGGCLGWRAPRQPAVDLPLSYQNSAISGQFQDNPWWPQLGDATLNHLMEEAFGSNLTFAQAAHRLDQSSALFSMNRSNRLPSLTATATINESDDLKDKPNEPVSPFSFETPRFSTSLATSYEVDLFGKLHAGRKAAYADLLVSQENLHALTIALSAQVARAYYRIIELKAQRDLLDQTLVSYQNSYDLVEARYHSGLSPSLDVYQAETALAGARASAALISGELQVTKHALAVLLGRYPGDEIEIKLTALPDSLPQVPPGLPSQLLERRPDVKAAFLQLMAADFRSAEAVAARFPSFTLSGSLSGSDDDFPETINPDNLIWNAIGNIVMPIFDAGRRKANAKQAESAWLANQALFGETLLTAVREVEDALVAGNSQQVYREQLSAQATAAAATLRLARDQYLKGASNYLQVIYAQTSFYNAASNHITAQRGEVDAYVSLVTALGGSWTDQVLIDSDRVSQRYDRNWNR